MDKTYADTVRLLLSVTPDVFEGARFAMKGGTAINLFVRDTPRLSVDIDLVYTDRHAPRDEALKSIGDEINDIQRRLNRRGLDARTISAPDADARKLLIHDGQVQVKVEANLVFRGTVLPIEHRRLVTSTAEAFTVELEAQTLAVDELYGSKIVAALDRQHPRDIFDVWQLFEAGGLSEGMIECFVTYLAGHNRPTAHVLAPRLVDLSHAYHTSFVGMTAQPVELETLMSARARLLDELPSRLNDRQRAFLIGLTRAEPDWSLLQCTHAHELPALQWKLINLRTFRKSKPEAFEAQASELALLLDA